MTRRLVVRDVIGEGGNPPVYTVGPNERVISATPRHDPGWSHTHKLTVVVEYDDGIIYSDPPPRPDTPEVQTERRWSV